jgi:hypothetical protein
MKILNILFDILIIIFLISAGFFIIASGVNLLQEYFMKYNWFVRFIAYMGLATLEVMFIGVGMDFLISKGEKEVKE